MARIFHIILVGLGLFGLARPMMGAELMRAIVEQKVMKKAQAVSPESAQPKRQSAVNLKSTGGRDGSGDQSGLTPILEGPAAHLWQKGVKHEDMAGVFGVGRLNLPTILIYDDEAIFRDSASSPLILFPIGASKVINPELYKGTEDVFDKKPAIQPLEDTPQTNNQPVPETQKVQENLTVKDKGLAEIPIEKSPEEEEEVVDDLGEGSPDLIEPNEITPVVVDEQPPARNDDPTPFSQNQPLLGNESTNIAIPEEPIQEQPRPVRPKRITKVYLIEVVACQKCRNDPIVAEFLNQSLGV